MSQNTGDLFAELGWPITAEFLSQSEQDFTTRAKATVSRTYARDVKPENRSYFSSINSSNSQQVEFWAEIVSRGVYLHQKNLYADAVAGDMYRVNIEELRELSQLVLNRQAALAGRSLFLGGTDYAKTRACCQFNCAFTTLQTVFDAVDAFWLLLNGCGVGFKPVQGVLRGFRSRINKIDVRKSVRGPEDKGSEFNREILPADSNDWTWTIYIGDSAQAWAKALGKLLIAPNTCIRRLVLDATECRGPGAKIAGYGWRCNGSEPLLEALLAVASIMNQRAGQLVDEIDILDIINWLGTVLSSRRSAEIALIDSHNSLSSEFAKAKKNWWEIDPNTGKDRAHRQQSNNTILIWSKPTRSKIKSMLNDIADNGGSEPAFCNAVAAMRRAPWFAGMNPCGEILLPSAGFCNLVTNCLPKFGRNLAAMERSIYLTARANYRQTAVDLRDGLLTEKWHQVNDSLRLCGVSLTGICQVPWLTDHQIRRLKHAAIQGAWSMADELKMPRPALVTTIKPEGTLTKGFGSSSFGEITEGIHMPLGEYIFSSVNFAKDDPIVAIAEKARYRVFENPSNSNNMLITFPIHYSNVPFHKVNGRNVCYESAVSQLERYRRWNKLWADHNVSNTISWDISERDEMADWIYETWDDGDVVAFSLLFRADVSKTAKDLGYDYLPQDVVSQETYLDYTSKLLPIDWSPLHGIGEVVDGACSTGVCPAR